MFLMNSVFLSCTSLACISLSNITEYTSKTASQRKKCWSHKVNMSANVCLNIYRFLMTVLCSTQITLFSTFFCCCFSVNLQTQIFVNMFSITGSWNKVTLLEKVARIMILLFDSAASSLHKALNVGSHHTITWLQGVPKTHFQNAVGAKVHWLNHK